MAPEHHHHDPNGDGFSVGVLAGLLLLIIVVAIVLLFYFGPNVFNVNVNIRSWPDAVTVTERPPPIPFPIRTAPRPNGALRFLASARARIGMARSAVRCAPFILVPASPRRLEAEVTHMAQGYCVKCKAPREIKDPRAITMKNGRPATEGVCPVCGTKVFKIGAAT